MNSDYLFTGISRGNRNDYKELYRLTKSRVYAVAITHVKDRSLAREVMVETYKRVWRYAYSYTTDMDGEKWLLEIARNLSLNALLDKDIKKTGEKHILDNLSKLLIDSITSLDGDRGKILILSNLTGFSDRDLASFLWYRTGDLKGEYRSAIRQLENIDGIYKELDIPATIKDNFPECVPDVWDLINSDEPGLLAYTSHELLDLGSDEYAYGEDERETGNCENGSEEGACCEDGTVEKKSSVKGKKKKRSRIIILIAVIAAIVLIAAGITAAIVLSRDKKTEKIAYNDVYGSPQFDTKVRMFESNGRFYFQNVSENDDVYIADVNGSVISEAGQAKGINSKDFATDGKNFYYRNTEDGSIYAADMNGENAKLFYDTAASNLTVYGDKLYYSGRDGIYYISLDGGEPVLLYDCSTDLNLERYDIEISDKGTVFFSAGAWKGIHYLTEYNGEPSIDTIFIDEAYTLQCEGDRMYFTYKELNGLAIYYFDLTDLESKKPSKVEGIEPGTGAFYVKNGYIYYEGYVSTDKGMSDYGIYRVSEKGGPAELLLSYDPEGKMFISDLYVSDSMIYCFYSTGAKNGKTRLEARPISDPGTVVRRLF